MESAHTEIKKTLKNWAVCFDEFDGLYYIDAYVGGEDGHVSEGPYDTRPEAEAAQAIANRDGIEYNTRFYFD